MNIRKTYVAITIGPIGDTMQLSTSPAALWASSYLFSWLAGFFCHYALDSTAHPYIIYVTTAEYHYPRCHMSLEHELDMRQIRRDGLGGALPYTGSLISKLRKLNKGSRNWKALTISEDLATALDYGCEL